MHRNVRVLHQPGPLRDRIKQDEGVSQCAVYLKPLANVDEVQHHPRKRRPTWAHPKESTLSKVFIVDTTKQPLNPVHAGRARLLLKQGKAAVYRRVPFTLMLLRAVESPTLHPLRVKIDPGSNTTGLAVLNDSSGEVVWAAELSHRGQQIKKSLDQRRAARRSRRQRKTRYRKPRFHNRRKRTVTLAPSLESRVCNVLTWVHRLRRLCPVAAISQELVRFDTQALQNPEMAGVQYQQGALMGYEIREYLLEKWHRTCSYCGQGQLPLQIDHIVPRAKAGSDRVANLTLACQACNQAKGNQDVREFLAHKPEVLARVLAQAKAPLRDAAALNSTRWRLFEQLKALDLPLETGSGGLTKYNRTRRNLPKTHWLDAACVGASTPEHLDLQGVHPLHIKATGHGSRQMCLMDRFGFPRTGPKQQKRVKGFQTGDQVRAVVTHGTKRGTYVGKVAVRTSGSFNITTNHGIVQGIHHRCCRLIARSDGYCYS